MGELDIRAADDLDGLDDVVGIFLQALLQFRADGKHGRRAAGVARVHAHGVDVLDKTDRDDLVFGVPNHFQLQFFPAQDRFLHKDLSDETGGDPPAGDGAQFLQVVNEAAARAAHRVGRADHDGIAEFRCDLLRLFHGISRLAQRHIYSQAVHGFLEGDPVLAAFDGVHLDAKHLDIIFFQDSRFRQL